MVASIIASAMQRDDELATMRCQLCRAIVAESTFVTSHTNSTEYNLQCPAALYIGALKEFSPPCASNEHGKACKIMRVFHRDLPTLCWVWSSQAAVKDFCPCPKLSHSHPRSHLFHEV
eukprot:1157896-Pelagomonas_calceolata.AAC.4